MPPPVKRTATVTTCDDPVDLSLRIPQARVLAALMPANADDPPTEWPMIARSQLGLCAGYSAASGTVTRALNGVREGSTSCEPHQGLLSRGLVEEIILDIMGVAETNYRATMLGVQAYRAYAAANNLPAMRERHTYINDRYKKDTTGEK